MPNPYDELLSGDSSQQPEKIQKPEERLAHIPDPFNDPRFNNDGPDDLDAILEKVAAFSEQAEGFSRLLSKMRVVDHKVRGKVTKLFIVSKDPHERGSMAGEKQYHALQAEKFMAIIVPMRKLATLYLDIVKRFNADIDEHYFSPDKTEAQVESEKTLVMDAINLQRSILSDASEDLKILADGLVDTERRLKGYVNAGGKNNISSSELGLLVQKREAMTSGRDHQFDYGVFDVNLLDKTAISLGIFMKETSTQYLDKLGKAFKL
ncbi:hypothetical protein [Neolewinella persica]|uniref:hypothetical protein n=1 Tax=Neolewinella persica TaxID=70998 RepID=UPI00035FA8C9|nr:hypothetical protein [Neolewinella persica]